jgi:hypothetical protein
LSIGLIAQALLILQLHGFGVMNIVGIDPRETLVGNLVVKINHKGFDM